MQDIRSAKFCSRCGCDSFVLDTRYAEKEGIVYRRRECEKCGKRWTTAERLEVRRAEK